MVQIHPFILGVVAARVDHDLLHDLLECVTVNVHIEAHIEDVHHGVKLETVEEMVGAYGGDATVLQIECLQPQVALESLCELLDAQVADERVRVRCDSSYAEHVVEIGSTVAKAVLPGLVVSLERLDFDECRESGRTLVSQAACRKVDSIQIARVLNVFADDLLKM